MKYSSPPNSASLSYNVPKCVQVSPGTDFAALWEAGLRKPMQTADTQNGRRKLSFTDLIDDLTDLMSAPAPINCAKLT